ncbi:lipopolysaccharide biosynthesis protein [Mucilaginibacter sp. X5P1]|uniref:lipopolysaccharide biosynthesis protein n=1 Tax=Mucilaginibacter sp. X5P1 TaxID=2723088 RepID=UPI0016134526|nr:lipopolysaccharide biosynthesis protein [Mucilaginibacter sp. X5P1]MBB6138200.1 hypothetical protein [Mucilaginibacter sp. X5P1]
MNQADLEKKTVINEDIYVMDLAGEIKKLVVYLKHKWLNILVVAIIGAALGIVYSIYTKPLYKAVCTFVLDDAKSGGFGSQYAGLASLAGINVGGGSGGIFQGDNILQLYSSRTMIEKALLGTADFNGKKSLLIDRFLESYKIREKWTDSKLTNINFNGDPDKFNRQQDSIISNLVELFNAKILDVSKPDKKLDIINVTVITKDELFSKAFTDQLVKTVNDFYIQTKTKKEYQNVQILQHRADSVKLALNLSIIGVASAIDADPNANPQLIALRVPSQKRQVDVQANTAIYSAMIQNLELAKISLRQEMPLIQIIDSPVLPLTVNKTSKIKGFLVGFLTSAFLITIILAIRKLIK